MTITVIVLLHIFYQGYRGTSRCKSSCLNLLLTRRLHKNRLLHNAWFHPPAWAQRQVRRLRGRVQHPASSEQHAVCTLINKSVGYTPVFSGAIIVLDQRIRPDVSPGLKHMLSALILAKKTQGDQSHHKHTPASILQGDSAGLLKHVIMKCLTLIDFCCQALFSVTSNSPNLQLSIFSALVGWESCEEEVIRNPVCSNSPKNDAMNSMMSALQPGEDSTWFIYPLHPASGAAVTEAQQNTEYVNQREPDTTTGDMKDWRLFPLARFL